MEVICLEDDAFISLVEEVVTRLKEKERVSDTWVSAEEAMHKLRITSSSTLQRLRDEGKIRFSQPTKKHILYDIHSIDEYLEKHAKDTF